VNIADVSVASSAPGVVDIYVLMQDGGIPGTDELAKVELVVTAKDRRPLTDNVNVQAPSTVTHNITLAYHISAERAAEETSIRNAIEGVGGAVSQYEAWQKGKLGRAINPDYLRQLLLNAGASRMELTAPVYTAVASNSVAILGTSTVTYGGLE